MISNYIKTAIRNLRRDLFYSVMNILGLAIGIAGCVICYLHIDFELSYDRFHTKKERIFRLVTGDIEQNDYWVKMAAPIPPVLKEQFPEVQEYVRIGNISWDPKAIVKYGDRAFNEDQFLMVDPSFFKIFDYNLISGSEESVLSNLYSAVITESNAKKFFGEDDPVGKIINVDGEYDFEITGVIQDSPFNSHFEYDFLISFENLERMYSEGASRSWGGYNYFAYLLLKERVDLAELERKIKEINLEIRSGREISFRSLVLQPLTDIHFQSNRGNQKTSYNMSYIYIFLAIALAVLIIASINFINLTTARSEKRIREVGLRKTVGAFRSQLILQFVSESVLTALAAMVIANIFLLVLLPSINQLLENNIVIDYSNPVFLLVLVGISLVIGILSGSYIAFYITSFQPYTVLKGIVRVSRKDVNLRKILLVFQFFISTLLIISSLIILKQLKYVHTRNLGLDKEHVIDISVYGKALSERIKLFKEEVKKSPYVINATASSFVPGSANFHQSVYYEGQLNSLSMFVIPVDKDFIETMKIEMVEGDLERVQNIPDSSTVYVLNESAVQVIGWDKAYGKLFTVFSRDEMPPLAGVVKNFNFRSLHHEMAPLVLAISNRFSHDQISIRVVPGDLKEIISYLESRFREIMPGIPFEYHFMDDRFDLLYAAETKAGKIISFLTVISIAIALFGIYALGSFAIQERTKEIAIRKVFGIPVKMLVLLLTKDFLILMLIGNILAWPLAWWIMHNWLVNFSYKTSLSPAIFLFATFLSLVIVFLVISTKAFRATRINPAVSLKYE